MLVNPDSHVVMEYLYQVNSLTRYILDLLNLLTVDIQPIRDLTLYFDILALRYLDTNISIFQNIIIWFFCIIVVREIIIKLFPDLNIKTVNLLVLLFAVHPLFSTTILWGVARKHILSFFFILLATNELLKKKKLRRNYLKIYFFYFLSIFSQPINLLWPVGATVWMFFNNRESYKKFFGSVIPIFLFGFVVNWIYYNYSPLYKTFYQSKLDSIFIVSDKILAFGHYAFQLILPINLDYMYGPGEWQSLAGIPLGVLMTYIIFKKINDFKFFLPWFVLGVSPLIIVTNTPQMMIDSYLLFTAFSFLLLMTKLISLQTIPRISLNYILSGIVFVFIVLDIFESQRWSSLQAFTQKSFERRPNCTTAINAAVIEFDENEKINEKLNSFLGSYNCVKIYKKMTSTQLHTIVRLNSQVIFYDQNISVEKKLKAIGNMKKASYLAFFYILAIYAQEDDLESFKKTIDELSPYIREIPGDYEKIITRYSYPYCEKHQLLNCFNTLNRFAKHERKGWL